VKDGPIAVREFVADDLDAVVAFSLRSWEPVFTSLRAVLSDEIFLRLHPDWRESQAESVRSACTNDERDAVPPPGSGVRVMAAAAEALVLAHRGELEQAEALARTAVATAETRTDNVWWQAFTHEDLATVLERAGRIDEARDALERSLAIWERKGCLPCAERVREQIQSLGRAQV